MKTKINIFKFILTSLAVVTFFSCDNPVALGTKLDILGPVVTIISPSQRQSVPAQFNIEGTVSDNSDIDRMIISAVSNNKDFPRQWRNKKGAWEISDDYGETWSPYSNAEWTGTNEVTWKITIDMMLTGHRVEEGEYTFNIQAWDKGGFTDDNSFKAIVLIVDIDPPKVVITNPYLYSKYAFESDPVFMELNAIPDTSDKWQDTAYLGKFITQEFSLKWQIEDSGDVWSIDINFYPYDVVIDNDPKTPLPNNYIYRYFKNTPPPPLGANPNDYVKLNGSVTVPDLYDLPGNYDGGELKTSIPEKLTVKVVAVCYDAAGNPNQEKTLGYFISWPKANSPWIVFTEGLEPPDKYYDKQVAYDEKNPLNYYIEEDVFTVYPGRSVKATAFQAHGVKEVKYTLYECNTSGNTLNRPEDTPFKVIESNKIISNTAYEGIYSTIFPWELQVPPFTGYYVFEAEAFSSQDKHSEKYTMFFRVHDITFPDFTEGPFPIATDPLFMAVENNKITISGKVSDATDIVSLCMVWINPNSEGYAAMSQLSYFRNNSYAGWKDALTLTPGNSKIEATGFAAGYPYDPKAPNRLWNLTLNPEGMDYDTNRHLFSFSIPIEITDDLGIGPGSTDKNLKSQIFLFRAQNPDGKCTVITYAPQGDTLAPVIEISDVIINNGSAAPETFYPNTYNVVPQFDDGDTITINGKWWEDSVAHLDIENYFLTNFEITVNNQNLPKLTLTNITGANTQEGTWKITTTVGSGILKDKLKDTLVIGVKARDIGGNEAETGCSWLIQSDNLRLMRISADTEDGIYKTGDKVKIFLEFSKPVKINNNLKPELILSSNTGIAARAVYMDGQDNFNSRQFFEYTVGAGHNTINPVYLNVKGLYYSVEYTESTPYNTGTYPFTWNRGSALTSDYEEVRITMKSGYTTGLDKEGVYYVRTLPTATNTSNPEYQFTLTAGKHIKIDTVLPTATSVTPATIAGHYKSGDIYITVNFSKEVAIGTVVPQLTLNVSGGGDPKTDTANIKVNGNTITFMYRIKTSDTTNGNQVQITGFSGNIVDLAGNSLSGSITGTLTGLYIDTIPLTVPPVIRVLSASNISNVIGASGTDTDLKTLYNSNLWFAVEGKETAWHKLDKLEYSINGGTSWLAASNITNAPFDKPDSMTAGSYTVIARQINKAGNVSPASAAVALTWDPGSLINRISSTNANGTYTNTIGNGGNRQDIIYITLYFRKKVRLSTLTPTITVNSTGTAVPVDGYTINTAVDELTFKYQVGTTDNTPSGQNLDVTAQNGTAFNLAGSVATDESGVNVNGYLGLPSAGSLLKDLKQIKVQTGALSVSTAAAFDNTQVSGGGLASDGSYNTALVIGFNRNIYKGTGNITIIQSATDYRLPAVLTESQFNKYSGITNVNNYYTRGSNGYIYTSATDRKPDTSTKYILKYDVDTTASANAPNAIGTDIQKLAEAFRQAERVQLSINANAVKISGDKLIVELTDTNALQVPGTDYLVSYPAGFVQDELNTPCPQVTSSSPSSVALGGIAKPFIRISKTQDTIETQAGSASQPRLKATQPFQANVRMDCRTPGSTIYYFTNQAVTTTNALNWTINADPNQGGPGDLTTPAAPGQPSDPQTTTASRDTYSAPLTIGTANDYQGLQWYVRAKANKGGTAAANWSVNSEEMAFKTVITYVINNMTGTSATLQNNGLGPESGDQIWLRGGDAVGLSSVPGFPLTWDVDEFETVRLEKKRAGIRLMTVTGSNDTWYTATRLTTGTPTNRYQLPTGTNVWVVSNTNFEIEVNNNGTITRYSARSISQGTDRTFTIYNQGNAPNNSTTAGLNIGDSIQVRQYSATAPNLADSSVWKFVTWEINVDTYFDVILGRDSTSTAAEALQYGPRQFSYQRAGWTSFKNQFRALPGKHRWLVSDNPNGNAPAKGTLNFSGTFGARPQYTGDDITFTP
jgi:hypothetical protein